MTNTALEVRFVCDACDGEGWLPAPVQCYDELDFVPCPLCKGYGIRTKRIYPDVDAEDMHDFLPDDYDPFALEEG
jgi:hypothetical protein